jgi:hypothetical protein
LKVVRPVLALNGNSYRGIQCFDGTDQLLGVESISTSKET